MNFPEDKEEFVSLARVGKERQAARANSAACFESKNVNAREHDRITNVRSREEEEGVRVFDEVED